MTNDTMKALDSILIEVAGCVGPDASIRIDEYADIIRAALSPVDVEKIKQDVCNMIGGHHTCATHEAVREAIDHLSQRGVLR